MNLIIVFDNENPGGYVAGASADYNDEIDVVAKNITEIEDGDTIEFICDYYNYDGEYEDSYKMIDPLTVNGGLTVSDVLLPEGSVRLAYRLTDIYNQSYWTEVIDR